MDILNKSDSEILQIAEPIQDDIVKGSNEKNWDLFSKHLKKEFITEELRKDVENQWENVEVLTSLTKKRELIGILRKRDCVVVLWKQWSTKIEDEFLEKLYLQSVGDEVMVIGTFVE